MWHAHTTVFDNSNFLSSSNAFSCVSFFYFLQHHFLQITQKYFLSCLTYTFASRKWYETKRGIFMVIRCQHANASAVLYLTIKLYFFSQLPVFYSLDAGCIKNSKLRQLCASLLLMKIIVTHILDIQKSSSLLNRHWWIT